jgi:hypothetical protein
VLGNFLFKNHNMILGLIHWCYRYLPTENNRRMKQISRDTGTLLMGIIAKREKAIRNGKATKDDLLGILLESNMREMGQNGKSDSSLGMSTRDMI